jgi:SSS family solute:Na+ symporter
MLIVFVMVVIGMVLLSTTAQRDGSHKRMVIDRSMFRVDRGFAVGSVIIFIVLVAIYGGW